jgi:hypothetical protein
MGLVEWEGFIKYRLDQFTKSMAYRGAGRTAAVMPKLIAEADGHPSFGAPP